MAEIRDLVREAIHETLATDARLGELDEQDLADLADSVAAAATRVEDACTCGYGGVHEPLNRRCDLNSA